MNPAARLSAALIVGLVLWLPSCSASLRGEIELPEAAIRYLVAFTLARLAIGFLARMMTTYAVEEHEHDDDASAGDGMTPAGLS